MEGAGDVVQQHGDRYGGEELDDHEDVILVELVAGVERDVHEPREEGVHRADIVEHVLVVHRDADEEDEEVEAPHHLREAEDGEVGLDVVVREVAEAGHPDVRRDVEPDGVVDLGLRKVVVQNEHDLHPALPLLGLVALKRFHVVRALVLAQRENARQQDERVDAPEPDLGLHFVALGDERGAIAHVDVAHDGDKLGGGAEGGEQLLLHEEYVAGGLRRRRRGRRAVLLHQLHRARFLLILGDGRVLGLQVVHPEAGLGAGVDGQQDPIPDRHAQLCRRVLVHLADGVEEEQERVVQTCCGHSDRGEYERRKQAHFGAASRVD
mmetsp:Transcript_11754/g.20076  ORF Transcript_11754/g.20076 Transcript_11754/m.20076 type:complete len:323 (-) Transcript_11754:88-1056(-)